MANEVKIVGKNNTAVKVTGQEELVVTLSQSGIPVSFPSEVTLQTVANNTQTLINQNTGVVDVQFGSPALPYTIPSDTYCAYSIITQGSCAIDGTTVPSGFTLNAACNSNETLNGKVITDVSGGSIFLTLQEKM